MASYAMICRDCRHKFGIERDGMIEEADRRCPQCSSTRVRQRLSGVLRNLDVAAHDGEKLKPKKCA
ncbi:MAG: hypothetical protein R2826_07210 [Thermoleophilia bacterium]